MLNLIKAYIICFIKHFKQKDKAGKPYYLHPMRVSKNVKTIKEKQVALLHDIIEDTDINANDLKKYGFDNEIINAIKLLSKNKNTNYLEYITNIKENDLARTIKISDLKDNMNLKRLKIIRDKDIKRQEKYKKALNFLENRSDIL